MSNEDGAAARARRTGLKVDAFALALVILLFAAHLVFGANRHDLAIAFAVPEFVLLLALAVTSGGAEPPRLPLKWPAMLFGVVLALGVISLLPLGPPLAHPVWSYVQPMAPSAAQTISLEPFATRIKLVELAGFAAVFLCAASIGLRREGAEALGSYLTIAGILYCVWAAVAFATGPETIFGAPKPYGVNRLSGSFFSANSAGTLFACLTILGLIGVLRPVIRDRKPSERLRPAEFLNSWPQGLLTVLAFICLLLSNSRGALLALTAAALITLGATAWIKGGKGSLTGGFIAAACLALTVGIAMFVVGGQHTAERLAATNPLTEDRARIFAAFWPMIQASPWLGYGLGSFPSVNHLTITTSNAVVLGPIGAAHNLYIEWLLQQGVPGALAMFGAVGLILLATVRGVGRRANQRWLGIACLGIGAVFAIHGLVDFALEEPSLAAFFSAVLGLGYGLAERPAERIRRSVSRRSSDSVRPR